MDYMQELGSLSLASRLKRLSDRLMSEVNHVYREMEIPLNVSYCYFPLLTLINRMGPQGITQASENLSVSHPAISKLANKMIKDGYLIKKPHPSDKRASQLSLTKKSQLLIAQATPVWDALKKKLDEIESLHSTPLSTAITQFETSLKVRNFSHAVLQELKKTKKNVEIINWDIKYKNEFKTLNLHWLNNEFDGCLTANDQQALNNPEQYYLARGGYLFFAKQNQQVVGTLALRYAEDNSYEISKMAVSPEFQGQGIGRLLLLTALNKARDLHATRVWLESNSKLLRAITLYQHFGFKRCPHPNTKNEYQRADIYMELQLTPGKYND